MRRHRLALALVLATSASVAASLDARACGTCYPVGQVSLGSDAFVRPANAGFLVRGVDDDPGVYVNAWIDGVPAELEIVEGIDVSEGTLARVVPTPVPGATVELLEGPQSICFGERPPEAQSHVAGPADDDAPTNLVDPYWDLHAFDYQHEDPDGCGSAAADAVLYVRGELEPEPDEQAARLLLVEITSGSLSISRTIPIDTDEIDVALELGPEDLGDAPLDEPCVRVAVADFAGNRSDPGPWLCRPCHAVVTPGVLEELPEEPEWSDDDLVDDARCGSSAPLPEPTDETDSQTTSDGDAVDTGATTLATGDGSDATTAPAVDGVLDRGCACRASASPQHAWWLTVVLLARRRRR